ncbi:MAG: hypothetical protein QMD09_10650 [Desulfatibacillaceae bacterium]|nr:hypothetical protein [Desulfatibacillaceae bacterium]
MKMAKYATITGLIMLLCLNSAWAQLGSTAPKHDSRVEKILKERDIAYRIDKDGDFRVTFDMGEGRSQLAFIMSKTSEYRNFEIREIHSVGYRSATEQFPPSVANQLLEDNFLIKLGAWAKVGNLAIFIVRLSADADGESLVNALRLTLESADEMEMKLTGDEDEF